MAFDPNTFYRAAFKKLTGRAHTDNNKDPAAEALASQVIVHADEIMVDTVSSDPAVAVAAGVVEKVEFDLELDVTSNNHGWRCKFPATYTGHFGAGAQGKYLYEYTWGIPQSFNSNLVTVPDDTGGYAVRIEDNGAHVAEPSADDYFFDYFAGILTSEDDMGLGSTGTAVFYIYTGDTVQDDIALALAAAASAQADIDAHVIASNPHSRGDAYANDNWTENRVIVGHATAKYGKTSLTTILPSGEMRVDNGSGDYWTIQPDSANYLLGIAGTLSATIFSITATQIAVTSPIAADASIAIKAMASSGTATIELRSGITAQATVVAVGNDGGGASTVKTDALTSMQTDGDLTISANGSGIVKVADTLRMDGANKIEFGGTTEYIYQQLTGDLTINANDDLRLLADDMTFDLRNGTTQTVNWWFDSGSQSFNIFFDDSVDRYVIISNLGTGDSILAVDQVNAAEVRGGTTSGQDCTIESTSHATKGDVIIKDLEPRYRHRREPFIFQNPQDGDIVVAYIAGHEGAGLKEPYAKIIRVGANVEGAGSPSIHFNVYVRTVDSPHSGGTALFSTAKDVTAYAEYHESDFAGGVDGNVDSKADDTADECVVVEVTQVDVAADWLNGWVELEIQD